MNRDPISEVGAAWHVAFGSWVMGHHAALAVDRETQLGNRQPYSYARNGPPMGLDFLGLQDNYVPPIVISPPIIIDPTLPDMPPVRDDCVCPTGSNIGRRPRPGWIPEDHVNGCGPAGLFGMLIPEDPMQFISPYQISCPFTPSCNGHDACYSRCNMLKGGCDYQFLLDMKSACQQCADDNFSCGPWGGGCGAKYFWLMQCYARAYTYFGAVSALGDGPFQNAQNTGCEDCCCP